MKIVNLKEFLYLPAGTLFAKFSPVFFGELCIKGQNSGERDFCVQTLLQVDGNDVDMTLLNAMDSGESFVLDLDCQGGDGIYNDKQLFAVYEEQDAKQLITRLLKAFGDSSLLDRGLVDMIDQVINVTGQLTYEAPIFAPGPSEQRFECTNLHTGEVHHLTADQVGEVLETGVAPIPPTRKVLTDKDKK